MRLLVHLVRASWPTVALAGLVGAASGLASVGLVVLILRTIREPDAPSALSAALFAALCLVSILTQTGSHLLLSRLTQRSVSKLRLGLCRQILQAPLSDLEGFGIHRLLASLTQDVATVADVMSRIPGLLVHVVILVCGAAYLGSLSLTLLLAAVAFVLLGVAIYRLASRRAVWYVRRAAESYDEVMRVVQDLLVGLKELKQHHGRRQEFLGRLERAEAAVRENKYFGDCLGDAAVNVGRLLFLVAIGLLVFAWPRVVQVDGHTLTAYVLTILFLMSPLEQIIGWLPVLGWISTSVARIERMGRVLDELPSDETVPPPVRTWREITLAGASHAYCAEGQQHGFVLGPIDLTLRPGEVVFVVGGNGSGKTTLAKVLVGLYAPTAGEVRLDDQAVTASTRETYRQLFSVVFDDPAIFDRLLGLDAPDLDQRAGALLRRFQLDGAVSVTNGRLSTIALSRGQRKRLALVVACLEDRPIYVFDEWAADQDPEFRRTFYLEIVSELRGRGRTVVAITHDDRYFTCADRVVKLEEGKLVTVADGRADRWALGDDGTGRAEASHQGAWRTP